MTQSRRPAGTPVGGQFAPTSRPEASGIELVEEADTCRAPAKFEIELDVDWKLLREQKEYLVERAAALVNTPAGEALQGVANLLDSIQDQAGHALGDDVVFGVTPVSGNELCEECGAELVDDELITDQNEAWCSLHPDNVVDVQSTSLPYADDPRIESSGGLGEYEQFLARSTPLLVGELRRFSAGIEVAAADKLERQHEALRGIQALLSDPEWDSPADRLETIAMFIERAGYAHEEFRPEVGEQIELQLADRTVAGRIELVDGDETLVVPDAGTRPVNVATGAIEWDRDGQVWYHAPKDEEP